MSSDSATNPDLTCAAPKHSIWPRRLLRILRVAALVYLGLAILLVFAQHYMIFPGTLAPVPAIRPAIPETEPFTLTTSDGNTISGLFCRATISAPSHKRPTILYFYGNASQVAHSRLEIDLFRECGANVLLIDYPGYGASSGHPSEASIYRAADALWDFAVAHPQVDERQIVLAGWSLGGAVAIDLASRKPAAGVMTLSAFTSMDEMAHRQMPFMPSSLLLEHRFCSIRKLAGLRIPIAIAHGDRDAIVPFEMASRLSTAAPFSPLAQYVPIAGAGHDDIWAIGHEPLRAALQNLLSIARQRSGTASPPPASGSTQARE